MAALYSVSPKPISMGEITMNNPNLALFVACVCCFVIGWIVGVDVENKKSESLTTLKILFVCIIGATIYAAISYWIL